MNFDQTDLIALEPLPLGDGGRCAGRFGMGGHQGVMLSDEWLTPPEVLRPLGEFDLDPCAPVRRPWDTARTHFTVLDDGLSQPWSGRIWLNPPYGPETGRWLKRLAGHPGGGLALIFARTDTECWFQHVWPCAAAVLFLKGRLNFHYVNGSRAKKNGGAPSALVAYGLSEAQVLRRCGLKGWLVDLALNARGNC